MQFFKRLRIFPKILLAFLIIVAISMTIGVLGLRNIGTLESLNAALYLDVIPPLRDLHASLIGIDKIQRGFFHIFTTQDDAVRDEKIQGVRNMLTSLQPDLTIIEPPSAPENVPTQYASYERLWENIQQSSQECLTRLEEGNIDEAQQLFEQDILAQSNEMLDMVRGSAQEYETSAMSVREQSTQIRLASFRLIAPLLLINGLLFFVIAFGLSRVFSKPLIGILDAIGEVARGNLLAAMSVIQALIDLESVAQKGALTKKLPHHEVGHLLQTVRTMIESLNGLVGQVQCAGIQVTSSATKLSVMTKQQEATIRNQLSSLNHVGRSTQEISEVAGNLTEIVQHVALMSQETAGFASNGQDDLVRMVDAVQQMEEASSSISDRLTNIHEEAENITEVVTTITKIADQTNLLSLNAAIEAEKAGKYGRGFAVVAEEIRRLADQTAVATLDIDHMVQTMQSAVSAGVTEMEAFMGKIHHATQDLEHISTQLVRIIEQVQGLSPRFDEVNVEVARQSEHVKHINTAMMNLSEEMQQTTESLKETFLSIELLNDAAQGLHNEVSRFKVT